VFSCDYRGGHVGESSHPVDDAGIGYHQARLHFRQRRNARDIEAGRLRGGDIVTGGATVILAMGAGEKQQSRFNAYLTGW